MQSPNHAHFRELTAVYIGHSLLRKKCTFLTPVITRGLARVAKLMTKFGVTSVRVEVSLNEAPKL